jgi:hypothetical protein
VKFRRHTFRPTLEVLEDRLTPSGNTAVASNYDGSLQESIVWASPLTGGIIQTEYQLPSGGWSGYQNLGNPQGHSLFYFTEVANGVNQNGAVQVFGLQGSNPGNGYVYTTFQTYNSTAGHPNLNVWSMWQNLGTPFSPGGGNLVDIEVASNTNGNLEVFGQGSNNNVYSDTQQGQNSVTWGGWNSISGPLPVGIVGQIRVAQNQNGTLEVFAVGQDGNVWSDTQQNPGGTWGGWSPLNQQLPPGVTPQALAVGKNQAGTLELAVLGSDNNIYVAQQQPMQAGWNAFTNLGNPGCFASVGTGTCLRGS